MAQALAKIRISPAASPGNWQVQATIYDTVTQTFRTESASVSDADARDNAQLQAALSLAFGPIDYTIAAPPTP